MLNALSLVLCGPVISPTARSLEVTAGPPNLWLPATASDLKQDQWVFLIIFGCILRYDTRFAYSCTRVQDGDLQCPTKSAYWFAYKVLQRWQSEHYKCLCYDYHYDYCSNNRNFATAKRYLPQVGLLWYKNLLFPTSTLKCLASFPRNGHILVENDNILFF